MTGTDFLIVDSYQDDVPITKIDGKPNLVDLLYTDDGINQYENYPSPYQTAYDVVDTVNMDDLMGVTDTIKVLMPTGLK